MDARVVLYSRPGCHLCDDARRVVRAICARTGDGWVEIDIDGDAELTQRYGELIPMVLVDGAQVGYFRIDPARLEAALA
ncbi:glutaredoxin family protein [Ruania halotolerans]|uniref:glutaredoxin family protein n=1 Tax=Ruania halotolerans TaxID=2897773 RepID=UPI001E639521|nr:glutaredoxin family protein [Ruania halotolerans]UFU05830.1 glutaredoxin family protein [Ruania halotolerans]